MGSRHVAQAHPRCHRRLAEAPRHRLCRSLPAPRLRPAHADRRGAGGARHGRTLGKSALHGRLQLAGLQGRSRARPQRSQEHRPHRVGPATIQSPVPKLRARPAAALRRGSGRGDPLQSAGRRPAHRQARPQGAAAGRLALPARHRRRPLSGALLARSRIRNHRCPAPGRQGSRHEHGHPGGALGTLPSGDHRADRRRQPTRATGRQPRRRRARGIAARPQDEAG